MEMIAGVGMIPTLIVKSPSMVGQQEHHLLM